MAEALNGEDFTIENAIVVTRLPEIRERLREISVQAQRSVDGALALEVNDENYRIAKAARASLNRDFELLEKKRKEVKKAILAPYEEFERIYSDMISGIFQKGISTLGERIRLVETELRKQRERELFGYFKEYRDACGNLEWLSLYQAGIKINLSCSMKSLKDSVKAFIDNAISDLAAINTHEYSAEVLVEFKRTLNLGQAISTVAQRQAEIAEQKARSEKARLEREALERAKAAERIDNIIELRPEPLPPPVITKDPEPDERPPEAVEQNDPVVSITVRITAPLSKQRALKQIFIDGGYQVESIAINKGETA